MLIGKKKLYLPPPIRLFLWKKYYPSPLTVLLEEKKWYPKLGQCLYNKKSTVRICRQCFFCPITPIGEGLG